VKGKARSVPFCGLFSIHNEKVVVVNISLGRRRDCVFEAVFNNHARLALNEPERLGVQIAIIVSVF
jgi:hypothetical protein